MCFSNSLVVGSVRVKHIIVACLRVRLQSLSVLTNGPCDPLAGARGGRHGDSRAANNTSVIGQRHGKGPGEEAEAGWRVTSRCTYIFREMPQTVVRRGSAGGRAKGITHVVYEG